MLLQIDLLASERAVKAVEAAILRHNSTVNICRTTRCTMDIAQILDQGAFVGSSQPPSLQAVGEVLSADQSHQKAAVSHAEQPEQSDKRTDLTASGGSANQDAAGQHTHDDTAVQNTHSPAHNHDSHQSHQHDSSVRSVSITHPGQVDMPR